MSYQQKLHLLLSHTAINLEWNLNNIYGTTMNDSIFFDGLSLKVIGFFSYFFLLFNFFWFCAFLLTVGTTIYFHYSQVGVLNLGIIVLLFTFIFWWRDIIREATFQGKHTQKVIQGLKYGMILFIISEICFFVSFFWAFFHSSLAPTLEIGAIWPPQGVSPLNPFSIPLLNTIVLLSSGITVTWAHFSIICGLKNNSTEGLIGTILLGIFFTVLQGLEYYEAPFSIADSIYGSTFFVATGFHGLHVLIG